MTEVECGRVVTGADDETAVLQLDATFAADVEDHSLALLQPGNAPLPHDRRCQRVGPVTSRRCLFEAFGGGERLHARGEWLEQQRRVVAEATAYPFDMGPVGDGVDGAGAGTRGHPELCSGAR